jgi:uncharacterized protein (DUF305 family)
MSLRTKVLASAAALALVSGGALAQMSPGTLPHGAGHGSGMGGKGMQSAPKATDAPSTAAYKAAAMKMHKDMAIEYSGDADVDFVRGMIPHHQAAIDMAKIELQYGKDADTRKLAEQIIAAQEAEIAEMQTWLRTRGK